MHDMDVGWELANRAWEDVVIFAYTVGVVVTGIFIERTFGGSDEFVVLGIGALVALVWTVYYRYAVGPRLEKLRKTDVEDGDEENPTPVPTIEK